MSDAFDPDGRPVTLPERVVAKILRDHPEMETNVGDILEAVAWPDHRANDPYIGARRERYFKRGVGPRRWLRVVVEYEGGDGAQEGRIVTAFGQDEDPT